MYWCLQIEDSKKSAVSESHIESLAVRQTEMEKLYESMISSLEGDNSKLLADLENLQQQVTVLSIEKEKHDKCCGTINQMTSSSCSTDGVDVVNRSMNTSLLQSTKGTETSEIVVAAKSISTDEDARVVELKKASDTVGDCRKTRRA